MLSVYMQIGEGDMRRVAKGVSKHRQCTVNRPIAPLDRASTNAAIPFELLHRGARCLNTR
eukprot:scaffold33069_cov43-Tisochrysis_lutea.AAC.1